VSDHLYLLFADLAPNPANWDFVVVSLLYSHPLYLHVSDRLVAVVDLSLPCFKLVSPTRAGQKRQ